MNKMIMLVLLGLCLSCGAPEGSTFGEGGILDAKEDRTLDGQTLDVGTIHLTQDSGIKDVNVGDTICTGALCDQSMLDDCAGKNKPFTSLSGVVYNPGGTLPLYDIYVYIPSTTPDPIDPGNPACTPCEAPASGGPIIGTLTNEMGQFTLTQSDANGYGVPSGTNIPLVIQTGKWRKQITIPTISACSSNVIPDPDASADKLRLPANSSEGDMPLIAFTSGCDPAECFLLNTVGISQSEFVAPTAPLPVAWTTGGTPVTGAGHVRFFTGNDNTTGGNASAITNGNTPADTYVWWESSANLLQYDIIFNACECSPFVRGATAYQAMDTYLNGGGRLFATHFYYNWFEPSPPATADLYSSANWDLNAPIPANTMTGIEVDTIDQTFPKGLAFATWLQDNGITTTLGTITLGDVRDDITSLAPTGCEATGTCLATQWIYTTTPEIGLNSGPRYLSANAPIGADAGVACGRFVMSDVHLSGTSSNALFPGECVNPDPTNTHLTNEKALEFLFFDLSSCVQDERAPPVIPNPPPSIK
jgi:hypothetical protein